METERRSVKVGPVSIAYEATGAGTPVILMHGLSGSSRWWAKNIEPLARRFRVYVVDLVGFGESRNVYPFILGEAAGYIARWMDLLDIERADIVGHSMGGFIAAELAADFPDRVKRLVLTAAAALPFDRDYTRQALGMLQALWSMPLGFWPILLTDAMRAGPVTIWSAAWELFSSDLRPKLAQVCAPTLIVWGERDSVVPLELGKGLCRYLPAREVVVIKGSGHIPMWERPAAFNRVVVDFLAEAPAVAPAAGRQSTRVALQAARG